MDISQLDEDDIDRALRENSRTAELDAYFGSDLRRELSGLANAPPRRDGAAQRSAVRRVFILPGIMGSKLSVKQPGGGLDLIWIDPIDLARGRIKELAFGQDPDPVAASGVVLSAYLRMKYRLRWEGFDVSFLPFDWRYGIDALGENALETIRSEGAPAALVCHSMGGLVARKIASLTTREEIPLIVTVGTPNHGSYSPVTVLRLTHEYVLLLGRMQELGPKALVERYIGRFPGLIEMMPSPGQRPDEHFFDTSWWPDGGVIPKEGDLRAALTAKEELSPPDSRFHQIVGVGQKTIIKSWIADGTLHFRESSDGDGTVPRDLAEMDGAAKRYYYEGSHGWLCNQLDIIKGAADLIRTGSTNRLDTRYSAPRSEETITELDLKKRVSARVPRSQEEAAQVIDEAMLLSAFATLGQPDSPLQDLTDDDVAPEQTDSRPDAPLSQAERRRTFTYVKSSRPRRRVIVDLLEGNILSCASEAYVIGVFEGVPTLGGAAGAIDRALDGALSDMFADGQITGRLGEITFVPTPRYSLRTTHVIVVGLGVLGPEGLASAIQIAGRNLTRALCVSNIYSIATVLWGAGTGMPPSKVFSALFEGMFQSLARWDAKEQRFGHITICEIDTERHFEIERELSSIFARFSVDDCEIILNVDKLEPSVMDRALLEPSITSAHLPDTLTVQGELLEDGTSKKLRLDITFARGTTNSSYGDAGSAFLPSSTAIFDLDQLDNLVNRLRNAGQDQLQSLADELFNLVFDENMCAKLDIDPSGGLAVSNTPWGSRVPWELLHSKGGVPIAINGGISRRYLRSGGIVGRSSGKRTSHDRSQTQHNLLLVTDPTEDLAGARKEHEAIKRMVEDNRRRFILSPSEGLNGSAATHDAVLAVLAGRAVPIDIMHYAGHAFFDPIERTRSGLKLHDNTTLVGSDIAVLTSVPRIVFLNACESGRVRRGDPNIAPEDVDGRAFLERIVGVAEAFILGGVSHLIGTIWPVGDEDAGKFAHSFYRTIIDKNLGAAVTKARKDLESEGSTAWVNYMHYGEPDSWL